MFDPMAEHGLYHALNTWYQKYCLVKGIYEYATCPMKKHISDHTVTQ